MYLIFCTSHLYIPTTLNILQQGKEKFAIYTDRRSISIFLGKMYPEHEVFLLEQIKARNYIHAVTTRVRHQKKAMRFFFDGKQIDRLYFFHEGFCQEANWLIKYLHRSQNTECFYIPIERTFDPKKKWEERHSVKLWLKKFQILFNWNYWCHFYVYMNSLYPIMDKSFFQRIQSKELPSINSKVDIIPEINKRLLSLDEYPPIGVVWLENTLRTFIVQWSQESYEKFLNDVYENEQFNYVFFKGHPDLSTKYGIEKQMKEIPAFIPGNLLVKRFSCYIGAISDLMFEAANAGTPTISILYLFDVKDEDREMLVNYLKNRNNNILFPKTIQEFLMLLRNTRNVTEKNEKNDDNMK